MESSQNNNNTNKIRIILPPPMILQNNNNNTSLPPPRLDNSLSLPILSSMSSNSNNSNSVFSGLLPKRSSSLAQNSINNINSSSSSSSNGNSNSNSNSNNNKIELPPIESLDHGNLKNSTFSQNRHSFAATTVNNNPTDFLSSNRMSVSAILSNNNNNNDDDVNNCDQPQHHSITTSTPSMISIPSLSSLTQLLDGRTANPKLYDDTNNLRNLHRYNDNGNDNNKNDRCSNNDARGIVGDDEIMEDVITNDNCKNDDNTDDDDVVDDVDDSDSDDVGDAISDEDEIISSNNARKLKRRYKKILQKEKERRHHLGQLVYSPKEILPPLEFNINSLLDIWIPAKHLSWENLKVRKRFLWGTDVYTDDSDIVAVLIHTGNYIPTNYPDHDLRVTIRVYRKLPQYPASTRNNYKSRYWGSHDGVSYKIEKVEKMKHSEMIGRLKRKKNKILKKIHNHNNVMMVMKNKKLIKEASRKSEKKSNDLTVFNKRGDQCCRYSPNLVSDTNYFRNRLLVEVMYLENDDETYEISYDEVRDKYRFAIVSSHAEESENNDSKDSDGNKATEKAQQDVADGYYNDGDGELKDCPLGPKDLYEIFRDDLEFHEMTWNILGLVVADKTNDLHNLFCIVQRVFWRPKTRRDG